MEKRITFTPGPWRVAENLFGNTASYEVYTNIETKSGKGGYTRICQITPRDQKANARLIAAAPDLLAATEAWVAAMKGWLDGNPPKSPEESRAIYDAAVAALKKARGEA